jgi:hypothetical protein
VHGGCLEVVHTHASDDAVLTLGTIPRSETPGEDGPGSS